jgi:hypothetical protein
MHECDQLQQPDVTSVRVEEQVCVSYYHSSTTTGASTTTAAAVAAA